MKEETFLVCQNFPRPFLWRSGFLEMLTMLIGPAATDRRLWRILLVILSPVNTQSRHNHEHTYTSYADHGSNIGS